MSHENNAQQQVEQDDLDFVMSFEDREADREFREAKLDAQSEAIQVEFAVPFEAGSEVRQEVRERLNKISDHIDQMDSAKRRIQTNAAEREIKAGSDGVNAGLIVGGVLGLCYGLYIGWKARKAAEKRERRKAERLDD